MSVTPGAGLFFVARFFIAMPTSIAIKHSYCDNREFALLATCGAGPPTGKLQVAAWVMIGVVATSIAWPFGDSFIGQRQDASITPVGLPSGPIASPAGSQANE
jgi:hypothetical protein